MANCTKLAIIFGMVAALTGCGSTPKVKQLSENTYSLYANDFNFPIGSLGCSTAKERFTGEALKYCPHGFDVLNQNVKAPRDQLCEVTGEVRCKSASSEIK